MKLSRIVWLCSLILLTEVSLCQNNNEIIAESEKKNIVYATIGFVPIWGVINLNYERVLLSKEEGFFSSYLLRLGGGKWFSWLAGGPNGVIGLTALTGRRNSHLETHLGFTSLYNKYLYDLAMWDYNEYGGQSPIKSSYFYYLPSAAIGYRFQKPDGSFLFRGGIAFPESIYLGLGVLF